MNKRIELFAWLALQRQNSCLGARGRRARREVRRNALVYPRGKFRQKLAEGCSWMEKEYGGPA